MLFDIGLVFIHACPMKVEECLVLSLFLVKHGLLKETERLATVSPDSFSICPLCLL